MLLIIMRHGEAEAYREPDHTRALTDYGASQCRKAGRWLLHNMPRFKETLKTSGNAVDLAEDSIDLAVVSPYLRTQQSYRNLAKGIAIKQQYTFDAITPMGNASQSADLIHGFATDKQAPNSLIVVTHMPLVSLLADKICVGFNARIFETADTLVVNYNADTGIGEQVAYYQGVF